MKKIYLLIVLASFILLIYAFTTPMRDVNINTFKNKGNVTLVITGNNIDNISEIIIQRGTDASEALRQIKILSPSELQHLKTAPLTWVDKFPVSGTTNILYRAVVTYKEGYQKMFPATETRIDTIITN
jgi:hypothetical protein